MSDRVNALVLEEADRKVTASVQTLGLDELPAGEVTVAVSHSTLNYKDGMIVSGIGRLVRRYPHVPGVDFAGIVESSDHAAYAPGDPVLLTGWRVGEAHWGGYAQKARVKADWLLAMPDGLDARRAMAVGTAGLAAMLAVMALEDHGVTPEAGEVLVTGAAGGVGGVAVAILAGLGYTVAASTGRAETHDYLKRLGAATIIDRAELAEPAGRPLESERWAGCVDAVGGTTLARVMGQMAYGGSIAACGLAAGPKLETTVIPLLLRAVKLLGIDTVMQPADNRGRAWARIVRDLPMDKLDAMTTLAPLAEVPKHAGEILKGQIRGRLVIDVNA